MFGKELSVLLKHKIASEGIGKLSPSTESLGPSTPSESTLTSTSKPVNMITETSHEEIQEPTKISKFVLYRPFLEIIGVLILLFLINLFVFVKLYSLSSTIQTINGDFPAALERQMKSTFQSYSSE